MPSVTTNREQLTKREKERKRERKERKEKPGEKVAHSFEAVPSCDDKERERERRSEREKEKKRKSNQGEKVAAQLCHLVIEAGLLVAAALTPVLDLLGLEEVAEQRLN